MASLGTKSYSRSSIKMPDIDEMTATPSGGLIDLVKFAFEYNQATAKNLSLERSNKVATMKEMATGVNVTMSKEQIQKTMDAIDAMGVGDEYVTQYGDAINFSLEGIHERRSGIDRVSDEVSTTRDELGKLKDIVSTGGAYADASKGALAILNNLEKTYIDEIRYIDQESGLGPRFNALVNEAQDVFATAATADQLDAIKFIEEKTDAVSGAVTKAAGRGFQVGDPEQAAMFRGHPAARGQLAQAAESAMEAQNWVKAQKYMTALQADNEAKGMKLSSAVRAIYPFAERTTKILNSMGENAEDYQSLPAMTKLFGTTNLNDYIAPQQMEAVFEMVSDDIKDIISNETNFMEQLGFGVFKSLGDYDNLDSYLVDNQEQILKDLDNDSLRKVTTNLLRIRSSLSKAYEEAYGRPLRTISAAEITLEQILKDIKIHIPGQRE